MRVLFLDSLLRAGVGNHRQRACILTVLVVQRTGRHQRPDLVTILGAKPKLKVLVDAGWLSPANGGWHVNPLVHLRFSERAAEEKRQREQIRARITEHADVLRDTYYRRSPLGGEVGLQDAVSKKHVDNVDTFEGASQSNEHSRHRCPKSV